MTARTLVCCVASSTDALTTFADVGVGGIEDVTTLTVGLGSLPRRERLTTQEIYAMGNCFQMRRTATKAIPTQMVNLVPVRNWALGQQVGKPVGESLTERAIAVPHAVTTPDPAVTCAIHEQPEAFVKREAIPDRGVWHSAELTPRRALRQGTRALRTGG